MRTVPGRNLAGTHSEFILMYEIENTVLLVLVLVQKVEPILDFARKFENACILKVEPMKSWIRRT